MRKILGVLSIFIGLLLISYSVYITYNERIKVKDEPEDKNTVDNYLKNKYNDSFSNEEEYSKYIIKPDGLVEDYMTSTDRSDAGFVHPNDYVMNTIYKISDVNGVSFFVKKVEYVGEVSNIPDLPKEGYYDNYINAYLNNKVESELLVEYKEYFPNIELIEFPLIEKYPLKDSSKLLDKDKKDMNTNAFIEKLKTEDVDILITISSNLTGNNIKEEVTNIKNYIVTQNDFKISNLVLKYNNDSLYINYDGKNEFINIYSGKNYFNYSDLLDLGIFDRTIMLGNNTIENGITYDEFMGLGPESFNF